MFEDSGENTVYFKYGGWYGGIMEMEGAWCNIVVRSLDETHRRHRRQWAIGLAKLDWQLLLATFIWPEPQENLFGELKFQRKSESYK